VKAGDVALTALPQADGHTKQRPIVLLKQLPGYGDWLVCGVSTQLWQEITGFDDPILSDDADFAASGLKGASLIRLGFLAVLPAPRITGVIGEIDSARHQRLLRRLSCFLAE